MPYFDREGISPGAYIEPLGAESIATHIKNQNPNFEVEVLHELVVSKERIMKRVEEMHADFVGISDFYLTHNKTVEYAKRAKNNGSIVIVGGPHPSATDYFNPTKEMASEILKNHPEIDFVVKGDGEEAFLELINSGKRSKEIKKISNLNDLPLIDRSFIDYNQYWNNFITLYGGRYKGLEKIASVYTSKGCPKATKQGNCIFCDLGERPRKRSPKKVADEIKYLNEKYGIKSITAISATMCNSKSWLKELLKYLGGTNVSFFRVLARADEMDKETANLLKELKTKSVLIGMESGNNLQLFYMNKQTTNNQNLMAAEILAENGIELKPYFVLGLPGETEESINDTINLAENLIRFGNVNEIGAGKVLVLPGSPLFEEAKSKFNFTCCLNPEEVSRFVRQKTCKVSEDTLDKAVRRISKLANIVDHHG